MARKDWEVHAREPGIVIEVDPKSGERRERKMTDDERAEYDAFVVENRRLDQEGAHRVVDNA